MQQNLGIIGSSTNSAKVAATVTGLMVSVASIIVLISGHFGFPVTVENVTTFAGELGTAAGVIYTIFGIIRKIVVKVTAPKV